MMHTLLSLVRITGVMAQPSTINHQPSTINHQPSTISVLRCNAKRLFSISFASATSDLIDLSQSQNGGVTAYMCADDNPGDDVQLELSVVIPCLNEADTLGTCIEKALRSTGEHDISCEVVVADNGSTDDSVKIAENLGARVIHVKEKGYGSALMGGIAASCGKYVLMADADDSYDFLEVPKFVDKLREGYDLVQGCRLPAGGGKVLPGAMPFTHRWFGNPLFSFLTRFWFKAPIHDVYCGMRGFTREFYQRMDQRCTGMEFATEMILKASLFKEKIAEVPITLHPDGRISHPPHLRTLRDGWRTLRFFLMYSPTWLFLVPGISLILLGLIGYLLAMPGIPVGSVVLDAHTLLFASLAMICGYQSILFAMFTKIFAVQEHLVPHDKRLDSFFTVMNMEKGLLLGLVALVVGLGLLGYAFNSWRLQAFGLLNYSQTMKWVVPGMTLGVLGFQTILSSFFASIIGMVRK